jgi:hypothetical protein
MLTPRTFRAIIESATIYRFDVAFERLKVHHQPGASSVRKYLSVTHHVLQSCWGGCRVYLIDSC